MRTLIAVLCLAAREFVRSMFGIEVGSGLAGLFYAAAFLCVIQDVAELFRDK